MQPNDPVVGGTVLRRSAIQSPNFVSGTSGWSIDQNGTAEFNQLLVNTGSIAGQGGLEVDSARAALTYLNNSGGLASVVAAATGASISGQAQTGDPVASVTATGLHGVGGQIQVNTGDVGNNYLLVQAAANGYDTVGINGETAHAIVLQHGWAAGAGFGTPSYELTALGTVVLSGLASGGTNANGTVVTNLPAAYRPSATRQLHASADGTISPFCCVLHIATNGDVTVFGLGTANVIGFDGLSFVL